MLLRVHSVGSHHCGSTRITDRTYRYLAGVPGRYILVGDLVRSVTLLQVQYSTNRTYRYLAGELGRYILVGDLVRSVTLLQVQDQPYLQVPVPSRRTGYRTYR